MLKTSHISRGRDVAAARATSAEDARHRQRRLDREADALAAEAQQVAQAAAGDVGEAVHGDVRAQQLEHRAHVDDGRLEQRVGDRAPPSSAGRSSRREPPSSSSARRASV